MNARKSKLGITNPVLLCIIMALLGAPFFSATAQNLPTGPSGMPSVDSYVQNLDPFGGFGPTVTSDNQPSGGGGSGGDGSGGDQPFVNDGNNPGNPSADGYFNSPSSEVTETKESAVITPPEKVFDKFIYFLSIRLSGFVIQMGANIFDIAYNKFVLKLGCWFVEEAKCSDDDGKGQVGAVVNEMWQIVRDIFNIFFIFALIYIGIRTILFTEDSTTRRMLGLLIAAALLINFSLYIAKTIVDIANFSAVQIHEAVTVKTGGAFSLSYQTGDSAATSTTLVKVEEGSIAGGFMEVIGFASFFQTDTGGMLDSAGYVAVFSIMLLVFSIILGLTFAYAGLMLIFRFIAIIFYLIFSPLMFLSWVVPQFGSVGKKWWGGFLGYAFYAPVFVFMILLTLFTLQAFMGSSLQTTPYGAGFENTYDAGMMNAFVFFAIAIGLLLTSTKVADTLAKQSGAIGMSTASKWGKRATLGAGAWAGGRAASSVVGGTGKGIEKLSNQIPGGIGGSHVRSFGETLQKAKIGGASSYKERADATKEHNKKRSNTNASASAVAPIKAFNSAGKKATEDEQMKMERAVANASTKQLESMGVKPLSNKKVAATLSGSQFEALLKSDELNDEQKAKIGEAREKGMREKLTKDGEFKINDASTAQLEAVGLETLNEHAAKLTSSQMDDLKKKLTETEFGRIKKKREDELKAAAPAELFAKRPNKEIAKLPKEILEKKDNIKYISDEGKLSGDLLKQIARENDADKRKIGDHIASVFSSYESIPSDVRGYLESGEGRIYGLDKSRYDNSRDDPVA